MLRYRDSIAAICLSLLVTSMLFAVGVSADSSWLKGSTDQQLKTLANIQPGLGPVMIQYSYRYSTAYYAAQGGNWDLAAYEIKEIREIQEVGEATRPGRAAALKEFAKNYLDPIDAAIRAKDFKKFDMAFQAGIKGCDGCHVAQGLPYIKYRLPDKSPSSLSNTP